MTNLVCKNPMQQSLIQTQKQQLQILQHIQQNIQELDAKIQYNEKHKKQNSIKPIQAKDKESKEQNILNNTSHTFSQVLMDTAVQNQADLDKTREEVINEINIINEARPSLEQSTEHIQQLQNPPETPQTVIHYYNKSECTANLDNTDRLKNNQQHSMIPLDQLLLANDDLSSQVTQLREKLSNINQQFKQMQDERDHAVNQQQSLEEQLKYEMEEKSKLYSQMQQNYSELAKAQASMEALKDISDADRISRAIAVARMKRDHKDFFDSRDQKYELVIDDLHKTIDEQAQKLKEYKYYIAELKEKIQELQDEVEAKEMQLIQLQMEPTAVQLHGAMKYLCQQAYTDHTDALKQVFMHLNHFSTADQVIKWLSNNHQLIGQFKKNQSIQCDIMADFQRQIERERMKLEKQRQEMMESNKLQTFLQPSKKNLKASNVASTELTMEASQDEVKSIINFTNLSKSKIFYISNVGKKVKGKDADKSFSSKSQLTSSAKPDMKRSQSLEKLEKPKLNGEEIKRSASQATPIHQAKNNVIKPSGSKQSNNIPQRGQPLQLSKSINNSKHLGKQNIQQTYYNGTYALDSDQSNGQMETVLNYSNEVEKQQLQMARSLKKQCQTVGTQTDMVSQSQLNRGNTTPNTYIADEQIIIDHKVLNEGNQADKIAKQAQNDMLREVQLINTPEFNELVKQQNMQSQKFINDQDQVISQQAYHAVPTDEKYAQTEEIFQVFQEHNDQLSDYIQNLQQMFQQSKSLVELESSINNVEKYEENTKELINRLINVQESQFQKYRKNNEQAQQIQQKPMKENLPTTLQKTTTVDPIAMSSIRNQDGTFQYQPTNRPGAVTIQAKRFYGQEAENVVKNIQSTQLQQGFNPNPGTTHQVNKVITESMLSNISLPEFHYSQTKGDYVAVKPGHQENIFLTPPEHPRCFLNRDDFKITGAPECYTKQENDRNTTQCEINPYSYTIKCDLLKILPTYYFYLLNNYERAIHFFYDIENDYLKLPVMNEELQEDNIEVIKSYCQHMLGILGNIERAQLQQAMQSKEYTYIPKNNTFIKYINIGSLSIQFSQSNTYIKQLFKQNFQTVQFNSLEYIIVPYHNIQLKPLHMVQKQVKDVIIRYIGMLHEHYKMVPATKDFVFVTSPNSLTCQETENLFTFLKRYCKEQEAITGATQQNVILYQIIANIAFHQYFDDLVYIFTRLLFDLDYDYLHLFSKIAKYVITARIDLNNIDTNILSSIFKNMTPSLQKQLITNVQATEPSLRVPFIIAYYQLQRKNAYIMARLSLNFLMREQMLNRINVNVFSKFCEMMLIKKLSDDQILELFVCNALSDSSRKEKIAMGNMHNIELKKRINYQYYLDTDQFMQIYVKYSFSRLIVINFDMLNNLSAIPVKLLNKKLDYLLHLTSQAMNNSILQIPMLKSLLTLSKECAYMLDFRSGLNNFMTLISEAIKAIAEKNPEMAMTILGGSVTLMSKLFN